MRKLQHRALERWAAHTITELQWFLEKTYDPITKKTKTNAQIVTDRANDDLDEAITGPNYDSDRRGSNELTGPEAHVNRRIILDEDGNAIRDAIGNPRLRSAAQRATKLAGVLREMVSLSNAARALASELITSHQDDDRKAQSSAAMATGTAGAGHCSNCSTGVPGTRDNRLISGRCDPCLRYWLRHHRLEDRPRELWGTDDTGD